MENIKVIEGNKPTMILLTNSFPFGLVESSFLKEESKFLSKSFSLNIVSKNIVDEQYVRVDDDVKLFRYNPNHKYSVFGLLLKTITNSLYYKELLNCIKHKKLSIQTFYRISVVMMRTLHFKKYLSSIVKHYSTERVIFYSFWNDYSAFAASLLKRKDDIFISRLHGGDLHLLPGNNYYLPYKLPTNLKADKLFFISSSGLDYFENTYYKLPNEAGAVSYLGVPEHKITYTFTNRQNLKIVSFSYVRDLKRINLIIDTLSCIQNIAVEWIHIGARYLFEDMKEYARSKLTMKSNIHYEFLGEMKNEEALDYISNHEFDFLINVSSTEGLPMTMMEVMSMGIPVIGTNVGGVKEIINNNSNGYLITKDFEPRELAILLEKYVMLPFGGKTELRSNAKKTWGTKFNMDNNYTKFVENIKNIYENKSQNF